MMTLQQTVDIPASRMVQVPPKVPVGRCRIVYFPEPSVPASQDIGMDGECPLDHTPNAETAAAIREGRAMMRGEIPSPTFNSLEELLADLRG